MTWKETHRSFIEHILWDRERFDRLIADSIACGILSGGRVKASIEDGRPQAAILRMILRALEEERCVNFTSDLSRVAEICQAANAARSNLAQPRIWIKVFARLGVPLGEDAQVQLIAPAGRRNYTYRVRDSHYRYVARYHDPLGRDYLQRSEPRQAARIYSAVGLAFGAILSRAAVVNVLAPTALTDTGPANEDGDDLIGILCDRMVLMPDYSDQYFIMARYSEQPEPLRFEEVVSLFVRPLARLHGLSRRMYARISHPATDDPGAETVAANRDLLRFPSAVEYYNWLGETSWLNTVMINTLEHGNAGEAWNTLLAKLRLQPSDLLGLCRRLWLLSSQAASVTGSLAHCDYTPYNCFVNKIDRTHTLMFDFDYLAIMDPAYEAGLSLNALLRAAASRGWINSVDEVRENTALFLESYITEYRKASVEAEPARSQSADDHDVAAMQDRIKAFGALALATRVAQQERTHHPNPRRRDAIGSSAIIRVCAELLSDSFARSL